MHNAAQPQALDLAPTCRSPEPAIAARSPSLSDRPGAGDSGIVAG